MTAWGRGTDQVVVGRGQEVADLQRQARDRTSFPRRGDWVLVEGPDGTRRTIVPVGDPPLGQVQYQLVTGGCPYVVWTGSGLTLRQAHRYAAAF